MERSLPDEVVLLDAGTLITLDWKYELLELCPKEPNIGIHIPKLVLAEYKPPEEKLSYLEAYSRVYLEEVRKVENYDDRVVELFYDVWSKIGKSPERRTKNRGEAWAVALGIRLLELRLCSKVVFITSERPLSRERFMEIAEEKGCHRGQFIVEKIEYLLILLG